MNELTYNSQIHLLLSRRRILKVHSTPIDPFVLSFQPIDAEVSRIRRCDKKSSWSQCRRRRPEASIVELSATTDVETETSVVLLYSDVK